MANGSQDQILTGHGSYRLEVVSGWPEQQTRRRLVEGRQSAAASCEPEDQRPAPGAFAQPLRQTPKVAVGEADHVPCREGDEIDWNARRQHRPKGHPVCLVIEVAEFATDETVAEPEPFTGTTTGHGNDPGYPTGQQGVAIEQLSDVGHWTKGEDSQCRCLKDPGETRDRRVGTSRCRLTMVQQRVRELRSGAPPRLLCRAVAMRGGDAFDGDTAPQQHPDGQHIVDIGCLVWSGDRVGVDPDRRPG